MYVDPVYSIILKEGQKSRTKAALCDVATRMKSLQKENVGESELLMVLCLPT